MIQTNLLAKVLALTACLISVQSFSQSVPNEKTVAEITRTATSGNFLTESLSKNIFKTETVKVPYTEQVPYTEEETYTVEVPYTDTETYVENIPYQVEVPYTDYITEYRQEHRCQNVTRYRNECRDEQRCYIVPGEPGQCRMVEECGVNVHGERICKTRQVCDGGSGPTQRCDTHQVCRDVPYTEQECRYENVPYQREVTRYRTETQYRQETRTRTVTRYRTETRTRTVTKYRDEQRCCRTETRQVFDRQLQFQVEVHFPADTDLSDDQVETLKIILTAASANSANIELELLDTQHDYVIARQSVSGATIRVELETSEAKFLTEQDLPSLSDSKKIGAALAGAGVQSSLQILDQTTDFVDVQTEYAIFLDLKTANGSKPLNSRTFTRKQVKALGGVIKMADVIQSQNTSKNVLVRGNTIVFSIIAKRTGSSPLLAGKSVKAQKLASVVLK
jgi:hypothetical protein